MKENRTIILRARLSKSEKELIDKRAKALGISLSAFLRKSLLGEQIVSKTDVQTVFELKKIGVNINQLARHLNTIPVEEEIRNSLFSINNYIRELKQITDSLK